MQSHKLTESDALEYMLAGHATITLRHNVSGNRYTYKINVPQDTSRGLCHFVVLLSGPDNESDFTYLGMIGQDKRFRLTKASRLPESSAPVFAFKSVFERLTSGAALPSTIEIWHEGRCGRCGRTLTVPESIERGIGPECAEKMGLVA